MPLAHVIIEEELYDKEFVDKYVYGFEEYKNYVSTFTPERACEITGADAELIRKAARLYACNKPSGIQFFSVHDCASHQRIPELLGGIQPDRAQAIMMWRAVIVPCRNRSPRAMSLER